MSCPAYNQTSPSTRHTLSHILSTSCTSSAPPQVPPCTSPNVTILLIYLPKRSSQHALRKPPRHLPITQAPDDFPDTHTFPGTHAGPPTATPLSISLDYRLMFTRSPDVPLFTSCTYLSSSANELASFLCERERKESNEHSNQPI
ncbi:hypothetical protein F5877DRAFT_86500 [Lentinula edodes]|nr:hypothetical protein F5877DRAFT_86500 [Lentinula edodes]